jgi:hypothetical protein
MDNVAAPGITRGTTPAPVGANGIGADKACGVIAFACLVFLIAGRRVFKGAVI